LEKAEITMPDPQRLVGAFDREFKTFITREIYPRVGKLQAEIANSSKNLGAINRLGVLYAQYGLDDQAEAEFRKILLREENAPALINLGNLMFLKGRMEEALKLYGRADAASPDNPTVLLCLARANHEIENYGSVKTAYDRLKKLNPDLAARFAYLDLRGEEATRAADITQVRNVVIWEEGQK
jgi:tetratricopeptide (TPR) repeat protein